MNFFPDDHPQEECGLIGVFAPNEDVATMAYFGLFALQHRGQEAAGIAVSDGVTMSMHPFDPPVSGLAGIARIIHNVEAYDRLFKTIPAKANCMTFCISTFGQMLDDAAFYQAVKHFGKARRIGCVHFSGVKGTLEKSEEAFPDECRLDMLKVVRVLKESGFNGLIEVDHAPHPIGDTDYGHMSHAFQIGYLKGILQGADALD